MRGSSAEAEALGVPQADIYLFQRPEKPGEAAVEAPGAFARTSEIAVAKLIGHGDGGRSHGAVFVRPLGPGDPVGLVDPKSESHAVFIIVRDRRGSRGTPSSNAPPGNR